ncbi:MAG: hypothetical protein GAK37_02270 [Pseudomonas sp.]|nr:MAG: hypothetical protein GAK37_02270 [Pseudomonas sp.]
MSIYFHAKTMGFYDTRAHGERTLWVPDPQWKRPEISVTDPAWNGPWDTPEAERPTLRVEDAQAKPPLIQVANPDCCLPPAAELQEVSEDEYQALFAAQASGKVIAVEDDRPVVVDPPEPTWAQRKLEFVAAVQGFLDQTAKAAGYDDLKNAISYADEPAVPRFQQQGQAFRTWRSLCWAFCYEQLDAMEQKTREVPSPKAFLSELPALSLPA